MIATKRHLAPYLTFVLIGWYTSALPTHAFEELYLAQVMEHTSACSDLECLTVRVEMQEDETEYEGGSGSYGFRDLRIGARGAVIADVCNGFSFHDEDEIERFRVNIYQGDVGGEFWTNCYNLDGVLFHYALKFDEKIAFPEWEAGPPHNAHLTRRQLDKGAIAYIIAYVGLFESEGYYDEVYKGLASRYSLDWTFNSNDVRLFDKMEIGSLWTSFENGQVMLEIRNEFNMLAPGLRPILIHYHEKVLGERLAGERRTNAPAPQEF